MLLSSLFTQSKCGRDVHFILKRKKKIWFVWRKRKKSKYTLRFFHAKAKRHIKAKVNLTHLLFLYFWNKRNVSLVNLIKYFYCLCIYIFSPRENNDIVEDLGDFNESCIDWNDSFFLFLLLVFETLWNSNTSNQQDDILPVCDTCNYKYITDCTYLYLQNTWKFASSLDISL